jgi:hypothetical protein
LLQFYEKQIAAVSKVLDEAKATVGLEVKNPDEASKEKQKIAQIKALLYKTKILTLEAQQDTIKRFLPEFPADKKKLLIERRGLVQKQDVSQEKVRQLMDKRKEIARDIRAAGGKAEEVKEEDEVAAEAEVKRALSPRL